MNDSKTDQHDHEYKAVVYHVQEAVKGHWDYRDHLITVLSHEKVKLFCIKCGDTKDLEEKQ